MADKDPRVQSEQYLEKHKICQLLGAPACAAGLSRCRACSSTGRNEEKRAATTCSCCETCSNAGLVLQWHLRGGL